ncbi:MAG TPA: HAD family hydrolase [Dehalococcoidia bacterium]|nr:HAD family hydrolase [Dehalococcoidia bacterium]
MKYEAVIFDLFGTLVANFSVREHEGVLMEMASVLAVPLDEFIRLWIDTFHQRATGVLPTPEAEVEYICQKLGTHVDEDKVKLAAQVRTNYTVRSLTPRTGSVETLSHLKSKGLKTGLISDCSREVPALWGNTPFASLFDVTVFSCSVGMRKPDPRIYQIATEQLGVEPQDCLYIGDGSSHELTGASQVGMHPVLLRIPDEESTDVHQIDKEDWNGPAISSLKEVPTLL